MLDWAENCLSMDNPAYNILYLPVLCVSSPFQERLRFGISFPAHDCKLFRGDGLLDCNKMVHDFMNDIGLQRLQNLQFLSFIKRVVKRVLIEQLHPQQPVIKRRHRGRIIGDFR
ncbi:hypothetical protein D3C73_1306510 [compost metagenome]